jgi:hypothetical protein
MSVQDFIRTAASPPDWLQKAWAGAKRRGLDALTSTESTLRSARTSASGPRHPRRGEVIRAVIDTNVLVSGLLHPSRRPSHRARQALQGGTGDEALSGCGAPPTLPAAQGHRHEGSSSRSTPSPTRDFPSTA